jgi:exonuclease SbcC
MKPNRLEFEAFGPFPGTEVVEFDPLDDLGLYLVGGPTGAGKTSIFDAMVFALYGKVPGARGRGNNTNLRSNFATGTATARTCLEFEAQGAWWRASREPTQRRAAKKGSGETTAPATATLERHDGTTWQPVETGIRKVDAKVVELVGLDHEQFSQVVLLPQGEFQQLLRAGPKERESLMRRLFATEGYKRALEYLQAEAQQRKADSHGARKTAEDALSSADTSWDVLLRGVREASTATGIEAPDWDVDDLDAVAGYDARRRFVKAWSNVLTTERKSADADAAAADDAHRAVEAETKRFTEAEAHRATLEELESTQTETDDQKAVLDSGKKAAPVVEALDEFDILEKTAADAETAHTAAVAGLVTAGLPEGEVPATVTRANTASTHWSAEGARFGTLVQTQAEAVGHEETEATKRESAEAARKAVADADAEISKQEGEIAELEEQLKDARTAQAARADAGEELREAKDAKSAVDGLQDARKAVDVAEKALRTAERTKSKADDALEDEMSRETLDLAGRLAKDSLVPGEPCPVCGSEEHPAPASSSGRWEASALKAAKSEQKAASEAVVTIKENLRGAKSARTRAERTFDGLKMGDPADDLGPLLKEVETRRKEATTTEDSLRKAAKPVEELTRKVDTARSAFQSERDERTAKNADASTDDELADAAAKQAKELHARVTKAVGDDDPADRQAEAEAIVKALGVLVEALGERDTATKSRDTQQRAVDRQMTSGGFGNHDEVRAAARPEETLEALEKQLGIRHAAQQEALTGLKALEKEGVADEAPDVKTAATTLKAANDRAGEFRSAVVLVDERSRNFDEAVDKARKCAEEASEVSAAHDLAHKVDQVCRGGQRTGSLESWVLARHLRDVAAEASERFQGVSAGRFVFTVVESGEDEPPGPVSLQITDHYNGETREVNSLSGGETFQASLSLALGLADTVQHGQGGIRIDSLFVDEGFGALDPGALDVAINTLSDLQEGGRTVGVISHLDEIKQRITTGLEVVKTDRGSHIVPGSE